MTGKAVPKCLSVARSDGVCALGFNDGSVGLWPTEALREAAQAAESGAWSSNPKTTSEAGGVADVGTDVAMADGSGNTGGAVKGGEEEEGQESVDSLPFMLQWDEKTGESRPS